MEDEIPLENYEKMAPKRAPFERENDCGIWKFSLRNFRENYEKMVAKRAEFENIS